MDILASFFDPNENGFEVTDLAPLVAILGVLTGIMAGLLRWESNRTGARRAAERAEMARQIEAAIVEHTKPIQPGYRNGGESLADIAALAKLIKERQSDIAQDITEVKGDIRAVGTRLNDHIDHHPK